MSFPKTERISALTDPSANFQLILLAYFEAVNVSGASNALRGLRITALEDLQKNLQNYEQRGYLPKLLCAIARKKGEQILQITTKKELEKLRKPRCPHFNGIQFVSDENSILEEELICWSEASLKAPLNETGFRRYMEVFRQVFPEESRMLPV